MSREYCVLCYSGTGNSRYIARRITAAVGGSVIDINDRIKRQDFSDINGASNLIFVTPTYCWRIPRLVREWIEKVTFCGSEKAWFVMDCGSDIGNAGEYNSSLCAEKGFAYMGTAKIVMPENYIAMFNAPKPEEAKKIIADAEPVIDAAAAAIQEGKKLPEKTAGLFAKFVSGPMNPLFYRMNVKAAAFTAGEKCIGCGKCAERCPLNNIAFENDKPVWGTDCTHCMACICYCPTEAIEYGRRSRGKTRYHLD